MLDGYKVTRLATHVKSDEAAYVAARWHHDRVGVRCSWFDCGIDTLYMG